MLFIAVNFHYVQPEDSYPFPGIYPTPVDKLAAQLERIGEHFDFVSQNDLIDAVNGGAPLPDRACLVTFDDGLRSQYENALPVLTRQGIPAVFFVNALPYSERTPCLVHKIHWLRANLRPAEFLSAIDSSLVAATGQRLDQCLPPREAARRQYAYDDAETAQLKFLLNNVMPPATRDAVVSQVFARAVENEADFCQCFYLSRDELTELHAHGFLGIHSYAHLPLSQLPAEDIRRDISRNLAVIQSIAGDGIRAVSYPYGGTEAVSHHVAACCQSLGLRVGFTMERAFNLTLEQPLLFARFDTNDTPGGKFPAFAFQEERLSVTGRASIGRRAFFCEDSVSRGLADPGSFLEAV